MVEIEFAALAIAAALVWKIVSVVKGIFAGDKNLVITQVVTWVAGVAVAFLLAASDFAAAVSLEGMSLADLNPASVILFGVALGSTASVGYDVKSAIDNGDNSVEPKLVTEGPAV